MKVEDVFYITDRGPCITTTYDGSPLALGDIFYLDGHEVTIVGTETFNGLENSKGKTIGLLLDTYLKKEDIAVGTELSRKDNNKYEVHRACAVDAVVIHDDKILLVERKFEPFKGQLVLPGGFVDLNETAVEACRREVLEETGIEVKVIGLVGVYTSPNRDPRQNISIAYACEYVSGELTDSEETKAFWWDFQYIYEDYDLGFDHSDILVEATEKFF